MVEETKMLPQCESIHYFSRDKHGWDINGNVENKNFETWEIKIHLIIIISFECGIAKNCLSWTSKGFTKKITDNNR